MEVPNNMDALNCLRKHLDEDGSDLLREMVRTFAERLMSAEIQAICNADYGEVTPSGSTAATGTGLGTSTPESARSSSPSPSSATTAITRPGCSSHAGGPSGR